MRPTILGIDDDPVVLQLHKTMLELHGYYVLCATSGRRALALLTDHTVDCVILDFHMPEMDGAAVAAEIKRRHPQLPIIILSGSSFEGEIAGVDAYVEKTAACSELPQQIQALLRKEPGAVSNDNGSRRVS